MQLLQIRVAAILAVARAVIRQRDDLLGRIVHAPEVGTGGGHRAVAGAELVDVVAHVQHRFNVVALGKMAVSREETKLVFGTGDHAETQSGRRCVERRRGAHAPDRRYAIAGAETVPVAAGWLQTGDIDMNGVIAGGGGVDPAGLQQRAEIGRAGHFPDHLGGGALAGAGQGIAGWRDTRPDHHGIGQRLARRHAMPEALGRVAGHSTGRRRVSAADAICRAAGRHHRHGRNPHQTEQLATRKSGLMHDLFSGFLFLWFRLYATTRAVRPCLPLQPPFCCWCCPMSL